METDVYVIQSKSSLWFSWSENKYQCDICGNWFGPPQNYCDYCGTNYSDETTDSSKEGSYDCEG